MMRGRSGLVRRLRRYWVVRTNKGFLADGQELVMTIHSTGCLYATGIIEYIIGFLVPQES